MLAFLLLHGWQHHRPPGHWLRWLAEQLSAAGDRVDYPQLPDPDTPDLDQWLTALRSQLAALHGDERVVVAHSLGCLLWIHHARTGGGASTGGAAGTGVELATADRVLLVAPPNQALLSRPELGSFRGARFEPGASVADAALVRAASGSRPRLVCSDNDPYCPEGAASAYGHPLDLDVDLLPGQAHLNLDAGYGPWPDALAWAHDNGHRFGRAPTG